MVLSAKINNAKSVIIFYPFAGADIWIAAEFSGRRSHVRLALDRQSSDDHPFELSDGVRSRSESMIGDVQLQQKTDCILETSAAFNLAVADDPEEPINKYEASAVIGDREEFVDCEVESARGVPSAPDAVPEPESSTGFSDLPGNDARPLAGSPASRGAFARAADLFFFLVPVGFAMLMVVLTAIFISASLPANLLDRPTSAAASVSVVTAAPKEAPTAGEVPPAAEAAIAGSSATAYFPSETAASQPDPANRTIVDRPPAPSYLDATLAADVPTAPRPLAAPTPASERPAVAAAAPPAAVTPTLEPPMPSATATSAPPPIAPPQAPARTANEPALSASQRQALLSHGDAFLLAGDLTSARLVYQRAANAGDGTAALRLGATFDAAFLERAHLGRLAGDPEKAVTWYRRARDLGNPEAEILLKSLHAN
jgi:hypothetical protein